MRISAVFILLTLSLLVIAPLSIQISPADKGEFIAALDVCHASGPGISLNADTPLMHECSRSFLPPELAGLIDNAGHHFHLNVLFSPLERPPKI